MLICATCLSETPISWDPVSVEWTDLPDLGLLDHPESVGILRRELSRSRVMRGEVVISAVRQAMLQLDRNHHGTLATDEVLRIVSVIASAL